MARSNPPPRLPSESKGTTANILWPSDAVWLERGWIHLGSTRVALGSSTDEPAAARRWALLSVALARPLSGPEAAQLQKAVTRSEQGDLARANLLLALAGFGRLPAPAAVADRIALAEEVLDRGISVATLMKTLFADGSEPTDEADDAEVLGALTKFDSNQPRVPKGSGKESGRWQNASSVLTVTRRPAQSFLRHSFKQLLSLVPEVPLLSAALPELALGALGALAAGAGFAEVFGILFVPSANSQTSEGDLPGKSGARYIYNGDEGRLSIVSAEGVLLAIGRADKKGIFNDLVSDHPFGRIVNGAFVIDEAMLRALAAGRPGVATWARTDENGPKLCPAPVPDRPGSEAASPRAQAYQEQIARMINGKLGLRYGLAISLFNPATGRTVYFDECDHRSGTMIDAKGPGYAGVLPIPNAKAVRDFKNQSLRQVQAAGPRLVVWFFAEEKAADYTAKLFKELDHGREKILIRYVPPLIK